MPAQRSFSATVLAISYAVFAMVALPLIFVSLGSHVSGFDCADPAWSDDLSIVERDGIYRELGGDVRIGLLGTVALGALPLLAAAFHRPPGSRRHTTLRVVTIVAGVWVMYGVVYLASLWLYTCGGQSL